MHRAKRERGRTPPAVSKNQEESFLPKYIHSDKDKKEEGGGSKSASSKDRKMKSQRLVHSLTPHPGQVFLPLILILDSIPLPHAQASASI